MASFNKVIIMGNLTRDPDVRATGPSGMRVARLGIAINERRRDRKRTHCCELFDLLHSRLRALGDDYYSKIKRACAEKWPN